MDEPEPMKQAFCATFGAASPFAADRAALPALLVDVEPVLDTMARALRFEPFDIGAAEHGEALALLTLLGRRTAQLDVSPTGAMAVVPSLVSALAVEAMTLTGDTERMLQSLFFEGFVAGREESIRASTEAGRKGRAGGRAGHRAVALSDRGSHGWAAGSGRKDRASQDRVRPNEFGVRRDCCVAPLFSGSRK
jgi:hypothetical protein